MPPGAPSSPSPNIDSITADMRQRALKMFHHAVAECSIARAFKQLVEYKGGQLRVGTERYDLAAFSQVAVVSIGKAGHSMADALSQIVPEKLGGIVACPTEPPSRVAGFRYFFGGHPMPNEESLRAGAAILDILHPLPEPALVLFLISGGASAVVEKPIDPALTLSDIIDTNRALVHSGAPIGEINTIRKHLSAVKGGRMAKAAAPAEQVSLMISDVPDNKLDALASGPTMPDSSTVADCYDVAERYSLRSRFPERVNALFQRQALQETPKATDPAFAHSSFVTALSNRTAIKAAIECAKSLGFDAVVDNSCDDWDYQRAADHLLARLRVLSDRSSPVCLVSGGEVTVTVGNKSGAGGRNQQFALYCARKIASQAITVLSAGTDGIDGNSPAAGALVDGTTMKRAAGRNLSIDDALLRFDAFPLLDAIGDAIVIGPTGNNLRDLRILLAY